MRSGKGGAENSLHFRAVVLKVSVVSVSQEGELGGASVFEDERVCAQFSSSSRYNWTFSRV